MVDKLVNTLVFDCRNRNNGYAEYTFQVVYTDRTAVCFYLVHHIEGKYHRNTELHQLHSEVQVSFDIRCVHYVYNSAEVVIKQKVAGHDLFA